MANLAEAKGLGKAKILNVKVLSQITKEKFIIGDASLITVLEVRNLPKISLKVNSFIKLLKPIFEDEKLLLNEELKFLKGTPFDTEFDGKTISEIESQNDKQPRKTLQQIHPQPGNKIDVIDLKVCTVSQPFSGKFSTYRNLICKDYEGTKISVTLYRNMIDSCIQGQIYNFENLKVSPYQGPQDAFHRLQSNSLTRIHKADSQVLDLFDNVLLGDFSVKGSVAGKGFHIKQFGTPPPYSWGKKVMVARMCF